MVSTDASGGIFTTISGIFDSRLWFGVPIYRGIFQKMDNSSQIYPYIQVRREVGILKTGDRNWFYHIRET